MIAKAQGAVPFHVGRPACPQRSILRIVTMAGMAVGREPPTCSSPAMRPIFSKEGDQLNHETIVRGKPDQPVGDGLRSVEVGIDQGR